MNKDLFEMLLHQHESETLDFKADQYAFDGADDTSKSEILKDILAFANSWRREDAHILIGVKEVRGGRSIVCGTSRHLLNRNLQQFINSKTSKPITFSYTEHEFEGKQIGVIAIPVQDRPFFSKVNFGIVMADTVYIRRGDTTGKASPDEVFRMGSITNRTDSQPVLHLSFADLKKRSDLGGELILNCTDVRAPASIPDYGLVGALAGFTMPDLSKNANYLRDVAEFIRYYRLFKAVGFAVHNPSTTAAQNVKLRFRVAADSAEILLKSDMPAEPSTDRFANVRLADLRQNRPVTVSSHGDFREVRVDIGTVQPGMTEWSAEEIYIGGQKPIDLQIEITVSADNLRYPELRNLQIRSSVDVTSLSLPELKRMASKLEDP